ncbi:MAG: hypothetical protein EOM19_02035 [Candidatus Moranbacteria bacterium]|nr:hypothetical protein [Candidatus Moranbacteria bacterium]
MIRIALFICSIIAIFFVVFQWMLPGFSKMQEEKVILNETKVNLENVQNRIDNFEKITVFLDRNVNITSLATAYLPESGYEERILNGLALAGESSGLYIEKLTSTGEGQASQVGAPYAAETGVPDANSIPNQLRMKNLEITFSGIGGYESIKQFLSNLASLERGFQPSSISVEKYEESDAETGSVSVVNTEKDVLKMDITLNFLYATKSLANWEAILEDFDTSLRSVSSLENIDRRDAVFPVGGLNDLQYTTGGKVNPFILSSVE